MMSRQTAAVLFTIWALVAMPGFCTGGILEHACECNEGPCDDDEASCCSDPCDTLVASPDGRGDDDGVPTAVVGSAFLSGNTRDLTIDSRACAPQVPPPKDLPYLASDRPLLI